jgi:hypothetical protein
MAGVFQHRHRTQRVERPLRVAGEVVDERVGRRRVEVRVPGEVAGDREGRARVAPLAPAMQPVVQDRVDAAAGDVGIALPVPVGVEQGVRGARPPVARQVVGERVAGAQPGMLAAVPGEMEQRMRR